MSREDSTEVRTALRSVEADALIAVNGHNPWVVVRVGETTDRDGRYLDTYWVAEEVDGDQQYRIWAHDNLHGRPPAFREYHPNSWQANGSKTDITALNLASDGDTIVSDTVAADVVDDLR